MSSAPTPAKTIDTVIFDVGNVLYRWDLACLFKKLIDDPQELEWFLAHVVTPEWHFEHDAGKPLADMLAERSAQFPNHAPLIKAYTERFNETIPGPVPGSLEIVRELAANDVPLFGITNFGHEFWQTFRPTAPIFDLFQDIVVSGTEKMVKPDPKIYHLAIARFDVAPQQALFVDDRQDNVDSARACGLNAHLFQDAGRLRDELARAGLL